MILKEAHVFSKRRYILVKRAIKCIEVRPKFGPETISLAEIHKHNFVFTQLKTN